MVVVDDQRLDFGGERGRVENSTHVDFFAFFKGIVEMESMSIDQSVRWRFEDIAAFENVCNYDFA